MAWFVRSSRNGVHMVYGQQASNSCGIACVMMVNFKMKKWRLAASLSSAPAGIAALPSIGFNVASAIKLESQVYTAYTKVTGKKYDGTADTFAEELPKVLNNLGIGTWIAECYAPEDLSAVIMNCVGGPDGAPVIVLVGWHSGGGHFVVCDTVVRSGSEVFADVCDPWDTAVRTVRLTSEFAVGYDANKATDLIDLGRKHNDHHGNWGAMNGWIIHQTVR